MRATIVSLVLTMLLSAAMAPPAQAGIDQTFVGKWVMPHPDNNGSKEWYWSVQPDGAYTTYINNPDSAPTEVGKFSTAGATFNLHANNGRRDFGTYTWLDKDHVKMSGALGVGVWSRMNGSKTGGVTGLETGFVGQWKMKLTDQFGARDIFWSINSDGSYFDIFWQPRTLS